MTRIELTLRGHTIAIDDRMLDRHVEALAARKEPTPVRFVAAAAHLILKPGHVASERSQLMEAIDFDSTLALRRELASLGFAIAESMDTAQRFEIGWPIARELIRRTGAAKLTHGFIAGAGQDDCPDPRDRDALVASVVAQAREIQAAGGLVILLPLPVLCELAASENDYVEVYCRIIRELAGPIFLHWLGPMFMPSLRGYFPGRSFERILELEPAKVRGAKLSLLDAEYERKVRAAMLARDQIVLTGDDHHFADLIDGPPPQRHITMNGAPLALGEFSHGLLGIFDAIARPASLALRYLAHGDRANYRALMTPLEEVGRIAFEEPTRHYKAGLAFLSWLRGIQREFRLVNGVEHERSLDHYLRLAASAAEAGLFEDAPLAAERLRSFVSTGPAENRGSSDSLSRS